MRWASFAFAAALACGSEPTRLSVEFPDELTGAPARTLDVVTSTALGCEDVSAISFTDLVEAAGPAARLALPIPEDAAVVPDAPPGGRLAVAVAARDEDGLVMARGCERLDGGEASVHIPLATRPRCPDPPNHLDLAVVFERSLAMQRADIALEGTVRAALDEEILSGPLPTGSRVRVVTAAGAAPDIAGPFDAGPPPEDPLFGPFEGPGRIWDGLVLAVRHLRDDARCAAEPVVLAVAAGPDAASSVLPIDASIRLSGAEADPEDDVLARGLALEDDGLEALRAALGVRAVVGPLRSAPSYRVRLAEARQAFADRTAR